MVEHLSLRQLEQYRKRALGPGEFIEAARHLAVCDACHRRLSEIAPLPEQLSPLTLDAENDENDEAFHLDYDEHLAPYVDGTIDDVEREIVESHAALCAHCAEQLRELFSIKEELARAAPFVLSASPPSDSAHAAQTPSAFPSWRERFFGALAWSPARVIAGVCICALLLVAAAWLWRSTRREQSASAPAPVTDTAKRNESNVSRNDNTPPAAQSSPTQSNDTAQANAGTPAPPISNGSRSVETVTAPQVAVSLDDGGRTLTLDREGRLGGVADVPAADRELLRRALRDERIETAPEVAALIERPGRLRGATERGEKFAPLNPIGTLVRSPQPVLRWQPLAGADSYTVKIYDEQLNAIAASPPLTVTQWTPLVPLTPGRIYSWQVTATKDGAQTLAPRAQEPQALFRVLSPAQAAELQRAERNAGDSHLLRAIVYSKFGLLDEAENELQKLRAANPRSATARRLLEKLRATRSGA